MMAPFPLLRITSEKTNHFLVRYFIGTRQGVSVYILSKENCEQIEMFRQLLEVAHALEHSVEEFRGKLCQERKFFAFGSDGWPQDIIISREFVEEYQCPSKNYWLLEPFEWKVLRSKYLVEEIFLVCGLTGFYFEIFHYPTDDLINTRMITEIIPYRLIDLGCAKKV